MAVIKATEGVITLPAGDNVTHIFSNPAGVVGAPVPYLSSVVPVDPANIATFTYSPMNTNSVTVSDQDTFIGANRFQISYSSPEDVEVRFIFVWTDVFTSLSAYNGI